MTMQQPEALRLADKYEAEGFLGDQRFAQDKWCRQAAIELRRLHARITELEDAADIAIERIAEMEEQMAAIGAGGVEPLRKRAEAAPQAVQAAVQQIDWESAAEKIAIEVADNCGTVPNLTHPHIYLGLKKLFAPAHPEEGAAAQAKQGGAQQ